jgi:hypothetical protein
MEDTVTERPIGLVPPHPKRVPHFCNDMDAQVHLGDGAFASIVNPYCENHIEWQLRYGMPHVVRYVAASLVESYDYLLSPDIDMKEATRRLRVLRQARRDLREAALKSSAA